MAGKMSRMQARELRIELLRARAAIERQNLRKYSAQLSDDLKPGNLVRGMLPASLAEGSTSGVLVQGAGLLARYPFLLSALSGLFSASGRGRSSRRLLRVVVGVALGWQALKLARPKKSANNS
ncbi:MAG: hypothetical protein WCY47_03825 [Pusillimonas sp.]